MFALPNPESLVSSATFPQAQLRLGSPSAQVCSGLLTPIMQHGVAKINLTRNY